MASIGNLSATITANGNPYIREFERLERETQKKASSMSKSIDKLQGEIKKKFSVGGIGGSLLQGLGIGSGFALAEKAAEKFLESYKQAADTAKIIYEMSERSLDHTKRMLELRRSELTEAEQLVQLERDAKFLRDKYNTANADKYRAKVGFFGNSLGNEVIPKTEEQQAEIANLLKAAQDAEYALEKVRRVMTEKGINERLENFFGSIEIGAEKLESKVNLALQNFFYTLDNPPDLTEVNEQLEAFFGWVEYGASKIDEGINLKLNEFFYSLDNPPTGMEGWTRYQEGMFEIFNSIGERSAATFSEMVRTGENALDSLIDSVADAFLQMAFRMGVVNPLLNAAFGLTGTSVLPALYGIGAGKADGGPVSAGMIHPVGERGMELFAPSTAGTIIPREKLSGGGRAQNVYQIDARGASTDAVRELRAMMSALNASIEPRSVAAVRDADKRRK